MSFVERAFTPPGSGAYVPPPATAPQVAPAGAPPTPPTIPQAPAPPPQFQVGQAPGAKQRATTGAGTLLGAAAATGQTAKKTLLGA